ncbi:uroporphyrinogen-III C-methyltransferase [Halomonas llamarensis]|uniref:Uroporphyrinogen-III C-methyltransferase n=1 Tax=Halomonas llamarensis TaxID=2945104 RepID=A0ABT0SLN9_9GAMM|nr:uroporphyrinogen-III C-methyltransferase [Halomonas llamarensis]MCL7928725.1 uroporphyrinogen-III C-methyltransferase [Halomonas llamarensis]
MSKQPNDQDDTQKASAASSNSQPKAGGAKHGGNTANANTAKTSANSAGSNTQNARPSGNKPDGKEADNKAQRSASDKNATAKPTTKAAPASGGGSGQASANKTTGGGKGGVVAIILVILLAIALAWLAWQGWQRLENQQQRLDDISQQASNSASQEALSELESRLESAEAQRSQTLDNTVSELRNDFANYRSEVNGTLDNVLSQLSQEQDTDEREWLHAEAAYLLRLANQRLQLERDVEGSAALLQTADERLADADNPALTPVRREIASELAALDAVPRVDRTGIYLALNAQQERIASLRLDQEVVDAEPVTSTMEEPPTGTFQRQLARFGEELKELVVIREHDEALEALITPEQESYLRQSLRLILEQSQLALLKEEQALFEASLDKALTLLDGYYDTSRSDTQSVIERLEALKQTQVTPELPDISGSQQALSEFIDNRYESRNASGGEA